MALEKDGFKFDSYRDNGLYIESGRMNECIHYAIENDIRNFVLSDSHGFTGKDIAFLKNENLTIEKLLISSEKIIDISPIHSLSNLHYLGLSVNKAKCNRINLHHSINTLKELRTNIFHKIDGIEVLPKLEILSTSIFSKSKNLEQLKGTPNLKTLLITGGTISSLDGLEHCKLIEHITIEGTPNLTNIAALWSLSMLKTIYLNGLKKINFKITKNMPYLESWDMINCGEINSIKSISTFAKKIKRLNIYGTIVLDADITPFLEMKNIEIVNIKNHKNYNLKSSQIDKLLGKLSGPEILEIRKKAKPITPSGSNLILPTENWKEEKAFAKHHIKLVENSIKMFLKDMNKQFDLEDKKKSFEKTIKELDKIQIENDSFIDTGGREQLVHFFTEVAFMHGITDYDDITWLWRENW